MERLIYDFESAKEIPQESAKAILGGKGAGLSKMTSIGLPVPPGFTITTLVCEPYYGEWNKTMPEDFRMEVLEYVKGIERSTGKSFGSNDNPLLVSVRSGAAVSMPGMMDTILNLGLNDVTADGLARETGDERFAYDCYRRLIQMFGNVVLNIDSSNFEHVLSSVKKSAGVENDQDLSSEQLKDVIEGYKKVVIEATGRPFPQNPNDQLFLAIEAVLSSWNNQRAIDYRKLNDIRGLKGTGVNIQTMVFGNTGNTSGTGVAFTRNPSTGENVYFGEYLVNAQGEDVVAGIRTPSPIAKLEEEMPKVYKQLTNAFDKLETYYQDMQDIEFTIEDHRLYLLQTRTGKRTAEAAVRIAVELVNEGIIDKETALMRVEPGSLDQLLHPTLSEEAKKNNIPSAKGLPASPGAAVGQAVFSAEDAESWANDGKQVILVRIETSPEDVMGMAKANGVLTSTGGMTSHAAVVGRGMGKCCVVGCGQIRIDEESKHCVIDGKKVIEGDWISLDGSVGNVYLGKLETSKPEMSGNFTTFMSWADDIRRLGVRTNADTPNDAKVALGFGAKGIGLCRTEHMFFAPERIMSVRKMILSDSEEGRREALTELLPMQRDDFVGILSAMNGYPVTIRTLDPPLHEFLPKEEDEIKELADQMGVSVNILKDRITSLHETNPMLGHRGCRLGITYPEITEMQARAIIEAGCELTEQGIEVHPEIMIPLAGSKAELANQKEVVHRTAEKVFTEKKVRIGYTVGTMIEIPRAALTANLIAEEAEFFSFGTNDLTQMGFGFSRDDVGKFVPEYIEKGIFDYDPFQILDQEGIGQLVEMAVERGRSVKPDLKCGICGEHGGEPMSVEFCHRTGLNYVSCSPYRVPIARLAAAQAVLREKRG